MAEPYVSIRDGAPWSSFWKAPVFREQFCGKMNTYYTKEITKNYLVNILLRCDYVQKKFVINFFEIAKVRPKKDELFTHFHKLENSSNRNLNHSNRLKNSLLSDSLAFL